MSPKLYTVASINRQSGKESPPRFDLAPMNHAAACNFMDACRNASTDYRIIDWPDDIPHPKPPMFADGYRRDKGKDIDPDDVIECAFCNKRIWFRNSWSPGDEAVCAECDTEVTHRPHPPSLNPDTESPPPIA